MLTNMKNMARLLGLTALAMLVQGYHPGLEDDAYYLAAIKNNLNPALFPHDADFFRVLFQATAFDKLIALSIRWTHAPLVWGLFFWQCAAIFLMLWGCLRIAQRCFDQEYEQWAAVAMVAALLTLPIAGTGLICTSAALILWSSGALAEVVYNLGDMRETEFARLTWRVSHSASAGPGASE